MPFLLTVFIDTDDDAAIVFEGKSYCFYGDDLKISRTFDTLEECYAFLHNEIKITPNQKVSECLHSWVEEFIAYRKAGDDWHGIHGNQTVEIWIDSVEAVKPVLVVDKTCNSCRCWESGFCGIVDHYKGPQTEPATLFQIEASADDDSNLQASLRTGPDFGCILYQPRN